MVYLQVIIVKLQCSIFSFSRKNLYCSLLDLLIKVFIDDINKQKNNVRDVSLLKKNYVFCNNKAINVAVYSY